MRVIPLWVQELYDRYELQMGISDAKFYRLILEIKKKR